MSRTITGRKRKLTLMMASAAARAIIYAKPVSEEIRAERVAICKTCPHLKRDHKAKEYCGLCGCNIASDKNAILSLPKYEENLPDWGCKHPQRSSGQGWKR